MSLRRFAFHAMAAQNEILVHALDADAGRTAAARAIEEVLRIEAKYSRYRPDSVVSRINAQAGRDPIEVDEETIRLLDFADACFRQSDGAFDATSGVLRRAWRWDVAKVPDPRQLEALAPLIGWDRVERDASSVRLPLAGMELDFGGFGKEYAADRAARVLHECGIESACADLAGDLAILGAQPDGSPWKVGIRHPRHDDALVATLPVTSGGVATSGDYERYVEVDGVRYCHLLDARTGLPARAFQSVTVHAATCMVAGAASSIAMLKTREEGLAWLASLGLAHFCVLADGSLSDAFGTPGP
jgi:FAD:protein FMN transferase